MGEPEKKTVTLTDTQVVSLMVTRIMETLGALPKEIMASKRYSLWFYNALLNLLYRACAGPLERDVGQVCNDIQGVWRHMDRPEKRLN